VPGLPDHGKELVYNILLFRLGNLLVSITLGKSNKNKVPLKNCD
jgi:hypothetical protein